MSDIRGLALPPLPSLRIQRRIASILSAYDDLIENNTQRIKALEAAAQTLYREWFVEMRFPGHESAQWVGDLPEGWEDSTIAEAFEIMGGGTPSTKNPEYWDGGNINWYAPSDLTAVGTVFMRESPRQITELGLRNSSARMFPAYSVMMTSRATIGVVAINTTEACTNQGFITCIPNERVSAYQIYFWIADHLEEIDGLASGATFKEIIKSNFKKFRFDIADAEVNRRFINAIEPLFRLIENLEARNTALRETRDLLLPRLISGEVSVEGLVLPGEELTEE
jgi:type I restriction enzyme S subunit